MNSNVFIGYVTNRKMYYITHLCRDLLKSVSFEHQIESLTLQSSLWYGNTSFRPELSQLPKIRMSYLRQCFCSTKKRALVVRKLGSTYCGGGDGSWPCLVNAPSFKVEREMSGFEEWGGRFCNGCPVRQQQKIPSKFWRSYDHSDTYFKSKKGWQLKEEKSSNRALTATRWDYKSKV